MWSSSHSSANMWLGHATMSASRETFCFFYHHSRTSLNQRPYSLPKKTDFPCTVLREQCSKNVWDVRELGFIVQWTVAFWSTNVNDRATFRKWKVCCILEYTFLSDLCVLFISCNQSPWLRGILVRFCWMKESPLFSRGTIFTNMINAVYCLKSELEYLQYTFLS